MNIGQARELAKHYSGQYGIQGFMFGPNKIKFFHADNIEKEIKGKIEAEFPGYEVKWEKTNPQHFISRIVRRFCIHNSN